MKTTQAEANPIAKRDLEWRRLSDSTVVVTHREGQHLALAADEFDLLRGLDGTRTFEDLRDQHGDASVELLNDCSDAGLLVGSEGEPQPRFAVSRLGLEFAGFDRLVASIYSAGARRLFAPMGLLVTAALIVIGLVVFFQQASDTSPVESATTGPLSILFLSVAGLAASVVHESAHALIVHHHGRRVGRAGLGFHWGALSFFVDATDAMLLPRRLRLMQTLAGPIADAVIAGTVAIASAAAPATNPLSHLLLLLSALLWIDVLVNLSPLLDLDGYWALSDALGRPNLRRDANSALRNLFAGDHSPGTVALAGYGVASVAVGVGLVAVSVWLWTTVYAPLVATTWSEGFVGKAAVAVFVGPLLIGTLASAFGAFQSATRRRRGGES